MDIQKIAKIMETVKMRKTIKIVATMKIIKIEYDTMIDDWIDYRRKQWKLR